MLSTTVRCIGRSRRFPASSGMRLSSSSTETPTDMAVVVQGPSLVQTGLHRPSPSLMFLPGLRSLPFWTSYSNGVNRIAYQEPMLTHVVNYMESHVSTLQREYEMMHSKVTSDYDVTSPGGEHAKDALHTGSWDWHSYMLKGKVQSPFLSNFPETAQILQQLRDEQLLFEGTPFGFCFFSTLHPQSSIQAHTGPMNFRLRLHLPLTVPLQGNCGIRVGPSVRTWETGKALVLDDSYSHQVWNDTNDTRVLLLVDLWHPDVTKDERQGIMAMFQHAEEQGWLGKTDQS